MEKILDEWTPYASINHIEARSCHNPRAGLRGDFGGRGRFIGRGGVISEMEANNTKRRTAAERSLQQREYEYIRSRERNNNFQDLVGIERKTVLLEGEGGGRREGRGVGHSIVRGELQGATTSNGLSFPQYDQRNTETKRKTATIGDKIHSGRSEDQQGRSSWRYRQDHLPVIKRNIYGKVEDKIIRKQEEVTVPTTRAPMQNRTNWLTEATLKKLEDYHSDNFSDISYNSIKNRMNVPPVRTRDKGKSRNNNEEIDMYKSWRTRVCLQEDKKQENEKEPEEEYGFVKRGILFWDAERRRREEERDKKVRTAKWTEKEANKSVREEEWIYKEQDTVWIAKTDTNIRKNHRERKLDDEKFTENSNANSTRERKYETRRGNKSKRNYWRIGYGDKGLNKELKVVRISNEQLTNF